MPHEEDIEELWQGRHALGEAGWARAADLPESPHRSVLLSRLAAMDGRSDEALRLATEAEDQLPAQDRWRGRALETVAITLNELGLDHDAQSFYTRADEIYEACGDDLGRVAVLQNAGTLSWHSYDSSRETFLTALSLAEKVGHPVLEGIILLNLGECAIRSGAGRGESERWIRQGLQVLDGSAPDIHLKGLSLLADAYLDDGDVAGAEQLLRDAPRASRISTLTTRTTMAVVQARLLRLDDRPAEAADLLRDCLGPQVHPSHETRLQEQLSLSLEAAGDLTGAVQASRRAAEIYRDLWGSLANRHARALEVWHKTQQLREQRAAAVERADALAQALSEREQALAELQQANARIHELSIRDPLTGLHNRLYLMDRAATVLQGTGADHAGAVALLDLDHFKVLNDGHGHATGDAVLQEFGRMLREHTDPEDLVARFGGEEFVVVRSPREKGEGPTSLAEDLEQLAAAVTRHDWSEQHTDVPCGAGGVVRVGVSIGVTPATDTDLSPALESADRLMYTAKRAGGNRVVTAQVSGSVG